METNRLPVISGIRPESRPLESGPYALGRADIYCGHDGTAACLHEAKIQGEPRKAILTDEPDLQS